MAPPPQASDSALVARLQARDSEAFAELLGRYHGKLLRVAQAFVPNRAVAEEVVQETWLAVLDGIDRFEGRASLQTWLFRIVSNKAKTRGERERRMISFDALTEGEPAVAADRFKPNGRWATPPTPWDANTPESLLADAQRRQLLEAAIRELPDAQRVVITLRDIEGLASQEVCNVLGITETNLRVLLHRARARLRTCIEQAGGA